MKRQVNVDWPRSGQRALGDSMLRDFKGTADEVGGDEHSDQLEKADSQAVYFFTLVMIIVLTFSIFQREILHLFFAGPA